MSKRAKEAALKAYPPKRKEVSMTGAIYTVVGGDFERRIFQEGYEQAEKDILDDAKQVVASFEQAFKQAEKDLGWHSVEESLPPIDEEVIVLTDVVNKDFPENKIDGANFMCFGHIVDPDAIVDVYGNPYKVVEYNGWNVPGVKFWMPMPKLPKD